MAHDGPGPYHPLGERATLSAWRRGRRSCRVNLGGVVRVLMVNHPGTLKFSGGDLTQMRKTAEALKPLGVTVAESFDPEPDARGFDLAHVFNLRTIHATPKQVQAIKKAGVPVVLSPIYLNIAYTLWANRAVPNIFSRPRPAEEVERLLTQVRERTLKVK